MFNSNDGGKHQYALMDGAMNFNRFGLKGNEGLGGGWAAVFAVAGGFSLVLLCHKIMWSNATIRASV
ncbi:hypothetical protein [Paraburkholderia youngii]|uniref:hypothetical protein n=1 Tax=Paraburkholderia youngii TaxID=2782701 RepID=UPI003D1B8966